MNPKERAWYEEHLDLIYRARHGLVNGEIAFNLFLCVLPLSVLVIDFLHNSIIAFSAIACLVVTWAFCAARPAAVNRRARSFVNDLQRRPDLRQRYRAECAPEKAQQESKQAERRAEEKKTEQVNLIVNSRRRSSGERVKARPARPQMNGD